MSTTTPNLGLFKYDPNTDGAQAFNIRQALNENWDKVDESVLLALAAAAPYSTSQTYALGAYCTREGNLYRCTTAITTAEAWTADHWTETTVGAELVAIYAALANKTNASAPALYDVPLASGYKVPWGGFRYGKDQFGVVHLYGIFATTSGMVKGNNTIGTLPEGFRPTMQVHAAAVLTLNDVIDSVAQFHVSQNGTLTCTLGKNITSGNVVDVGVDISFVSSI